LATAKQLNAFIAIQFLTGVATVTPQIMLPLVGDLAPPQRRASAMSIVVSGLTMGIHDRVPSLALSILAIRGASVYDLDTALSVHARLSVLKPKRSELLQDAVEYADHVD
jgi:hypothetical protein